MATTTFSIRLEEGTKKKLDEFCAKVGISTNAAFCLFANRVVMDKRIPFDIADTTSQYNQWVSAQLKDRENKASNPETVWYTHDEFWQKVNKL